MPQNKVLLSLRGLRKTFDTQEAVSGLDLDVYEGEFITLLGPSGCGKTTTLRIIAGLEMPTAGRVFLDSEDITRLAPEKREVNTVFQNYALFPHMNVWKNIAYGLRMRGASRAEIDEKVPQMLEMVQLEGFGRRLPSQLSGGQRQRVAIARSLILSPKLLLLDEPLGALDLQLRRQMQQELKRMQRQLGITFIYITHDQEE
ncbi:MAG TPA: ATP-binding cassette domain-containing protein, partial [Clostridia bacterium]|nr:ATP-binding cassette domain-containing protein [Clostridia bacterium]